MNLVDLYSSPLEIINSKINDIALDDTNTDQNKSTDEIKNTDDVIITNDCTVTRRQRVAALNADTKWKLTDNLKFL